MMPLAFVPNGEKNVIRKITGKDELRRHMAELGFVVGETVTVIAKAGGNMIVSVKGTRIAIDPGMASRIMV